jgi:hypothetical protein
MKWSDGGSEKTIKTDKPIAFWRLAFWSLDGTEIISHPESSFVGLT